MTSEAARRVAIVFDGATWHVRHIRRIEHDLDRDEKVYRCDMPVSNDHSTLADVPEIQKIAAEAVWAERARCIGIVEKMANGAVYAAALREEHPEVHPGCPVCEGDAAALREEPR